jgi:hypothetical protein
LAEPLACVAVLAATKSWRPTMRAVAMLSFGLLLALSGMAASGVATAQSRVGVTSGTSGDPLGKPPAQAERVLHVGVDVQANEAITTGAADRAHLLFLDGSSLTVGPQARLTIDKFIYDPATKTGDLAVHVGEGVFRFVGGRISKTRPVSVVTPSASLTIRGGIMLIDVQPTMTVATFVFGAEMTVIANGVKQTVSRPGWQVTVLNGTAPTKPVQAAPGSLSPEFAKLEALRPQAGAGDPDQVVQSSGFDSQNSGRGPSSGPGGVDPNNLGDANNAVSGANTQTQRPTFIPQPKTVPINQGGNQFGH